LNGTNQLLIDTLANLLDDSKKRFAESVLVTSKFVCIEANTEKNNYMFMSREENAGQSHDIKIVNKYFDT
jgi:hypothetical protein